MVMRRATLLVSSVFVAALGCVEGPFAHTNPNDPDYRGSLSLIASRDTVSPANPVVVMQLISDPVLSGYTPVWEAFPEAALVHEGDGVFRLGTTPVALDSVFVRARFLGGNDAGRYIYRVPSP